MPAITITTSAGEERAGTGVGQSADGIPPQAVVDRRPDGGSTASENPDDMDTGLASDSVSPETDGGGRVEHTRVDDQTTHEQDEGLQLSNKQPADTHNLQDHVTNEAVPDVSSKSSAELESSNIPGEDSLETQKEIPTSLTSRPTSSDDPNFVWDSTKNDSETAAAAQADDPGVAGSSLGVPERAPTEGEARPVIEVVAETIENSQVSKDSTGLQDPANYVRLLPEPVYINPTTTDRPASVDWSDRPSLGSRLSNTSLRVQDGAESAHEQNRGSDLQEKTVPREGLKEPTHDEPFSRVKTDFGSDSNLSVPDPAGRIGGVQAKYQDEDTPNLNGGSVDKPPKKDDVSSLGNNGLSSEGTFLITIGRRASAEASYEIPGAETTKLGLPVYRARSNPAPRPNSPANTTTEDSRLPSPNLQTTTPGERSHQGKKIPSDGTEETAGGITEADLGGSREGQGEDRDRAGQGDAGDDEDKRTEWRLAESSQPNPEKSSGDDDEFHRPTNPRADIKALGARPASQSDVLEVVASLKDTDKSKASDNDSEVSDAESEASGAENEASDAESETGDVTDPTLTEAAPGYSRSNSTANLRSSSRSTARARSRTDSRSSSGPGNDERDRSQHNPILAVEIRTAPEIRTSPERGRDPHEPKGHTRVKRKQPVDAPRRQPLFTRVVRTRKPGGETMGTGMARQSGKASQIGHRRRAQSTPGRGRKDELVRREKTLGSLRQLTSKTDGMVRSLCRA